MVDMEREECLETVGKLANKLKDDTETEVTFKTVSSPASASTNISTVSRCTNISGAATTIGAAVSAGAIGVAGATAGGHVEELATEKVFQVMPKGFLCVAASTPASVPAVDRMSHVMPPVLGIDKGAAKGMLAG